IFCVMISRHQRHTLFTYTTLFRSHLIMEVVRENKDNLNAEIKISIKEEDYAAKVDAALKKYRKQAKVPGFRSGMVPMGMVKKMRSEEHTSELQSRENLVCRLLLEK